MLSEVLNALLITYLATEYLVATQQQPQPRAAVVLWHRRPRYVVPCVAVGLVNLVERLSFGTALSRALHQFFHLPKILFAAGSYVIVLYYDCLRVQSTLQVAPFLKQVGLAFLYVLPVYPFLAVLISFCFLLVIHVVEFLHLPEEWLNWPIYYGVLYGPFSFVYWRVKEKIIQERTTLPSSSTAGRVLGTAA